MDQELTQRLAAADMNDELRAALGSLLEDYNALAPQLDKLPRFRTAYLMNRLVDEAIDPAVETHWWELALDLTAKAAASKGQDGQAVIQAIAQAKVLLAQRLGPYEEVSLRPITAETVRGILYLSETLRPPQRYMVAENAISLAQAHFNPHARFWAIYAGQAAVGFIMIVDNEEEPDYHLWRFMIAEPYQGRGYGRQAIWRLVEYLRTRPGAKELSLSCGQGEGSPEGFYRSLGFLPTGEIEDGEMVMKMEIENFKP